MKTFKMERLIDNSQETSFAGEPVNGHGGDQRQRRGQVLQITTRSWPKPAIGMSTHREPMAGFIPGAAQWKRSIVSPILSLRGMQAAIDCTFPRLPLIPLFGATALQVPQFCKADSTSRANRGPKRTTSSISTLRLCAAVAAGLLLTAVVTEKRLQQRPPIRQLTANDVIPKAGPSHGLLTRFWETVGARSAVRIVEDFHGSMAAWSAPRFSHAGWKHQQQGYVQPGELGLFRPSLQDSDYTLKFLGQIESASLGWVVRASDRNNYYAVKVTVVEPGPRQFVAIEHFAVIHGKTSHYSKTPLAIMMHDGNPFRVTVNVKGDQILTSIEGDQVDSWNDGRLRKGAVGFFSGTGESARVYWMELSKNQDWLGRVCARLTGVAQGDSNGATASCVPLGNPIFPSGSAQRYAMFLPTSMVIGLGIGKSSKTLALGRTYIGTL